MKKSARKKKESFIEKVEEKVVETLVPVEDKKMKKSFFGIFSKRRYQVGAFVVFAFVIIGVLVGYNWLQSGQPAVGTDGKLNSQAVKALIDEVADKMVLPQNETPTIATVTDVTKLSDQPFFRNAKNGDKVMIFGSTKEAILYRPSIHKIIAVAPINAATNPTGIPSQASVSATPSGSITSTPTKATEKIKVVVLNSTKEAGLAKKAASLIDKEKFEVVSTSNAQGEYKTTSVSSVSKDRKVADSDLKTVAATFSKVKATISSLPSGEVAPAGADVVVIVGSDFTSSY